jgi:glycosyltransferase involved in cell wall biosynthesis
VLWFTNTFVPDKEQSEQYTLRQSGGWMLALCQALQERQPEIKLAIATTGPVTSIEKYSSGGIDCFVIPMQNKNSERQQAHALKVCVQIVEEFSPDIVHIHGTERFFGLLSARNLTSVPTVISIQGLLIPYSEWYHFFGNRSLFDIIKLHRIIEIPVMRGLLWDYYRFCKAAQREREIVVGNRFFMGRTIWDRAHLFSINPEAKHYHVGEMLREPFWHAHWGIAQCQRHRILFINPGQPRKGVETLFKATDILRRDYADIEVALVGTISARRGYGRYIRKEIMERQEYVRELGALNAEEMTRELCRSHVFVSPSYIENSPNTVCEAQLVGVPVVCSYTGGVPSLIENRRTGMFFPTGDAPFLASVFKQVFEDDDLAKALSQNAQNEASKRHDAKTIMQDLLSAYHRVINDCN